MKAVDCTFSVAKSHSRLIWLVNSGIANRAVPAQTVRELSAAVTHEEVRRFVESSGLQILSGEMRQHPSANAIAIASPKVVSIPGDAKYFDPEIVFPKVDSLEVPFGTVLINCLLPHVEDVDAAETIFRAYQEMILAFSRRMDALPSACITGYKSRMEGRPHDLYHRGFRFFYSPEPDMFYDKIYASLKAMQDLVSLPDDAPSSERHRLVGIIQGAKFCKVEGRQVGHAILEDIKPQTAETVLVDFRIS